MQANLTKISLSYTLYNHSFSKNSDTWMSHFQDSFCLCIKTRLRAKPFIWKCVPPTSSFSCKSNSFSYKRFFSRKCFEIRGTRRLRNSLLQHVRNRLFPDCLLILRGNTSLRISPTDLFLCESNYFHMKNFARGLVFKQRQKATWKWPKSPLIDYWLPAQIQWQC